MSASPYLIDGFSPHAQFAIALKTFLTELCIHYKIETTSDFLATSWGKNTTLLRDYFKDAGATQLRFNNTEAIKAVSTSLDELVGYVQTELTNKGVTIDLSATMNDAGQKFHGSDIKKHEVSSRFEEVGKLLSKICPDAKSAALPGIPICDVGYLKTRSFGFRHGAVADRRKTGIFPVVRLARQYNVSHQYDVNLFVLDLLWIRPAPTVPSKKHKVSNYDVPGSLEGYYFSAVDHQAFEIKFVGHRDDLLLIDAVAHLNAGKSKSMCIYLPEHEGDDAVISLGHIMGNLRNEHRKDRTGAWSVAVLRPKWPEKEETKVSADITVYSEYLKSLVKPADSDEYDKQIVYLTDYVHRVGLAGVIRTEMIENFDFDSLNLDTTEIEKFKSPLANSSLKYTAFRQLFDLDDMQLKLAEPSIEAFVRQLPKDAPALEVAKLVARQNVFNSGTAPKRVRTREWKNEGKMPELKEKLELLSPNYGDRYLPYKIYKAQMKTMEK